MKRALFLLVLAVVATGGCSTIGYYAQAVGGQLDILGRAEPIDEILNTRSTDGQASATGPLRARLEVVLAIRDFASRQLMLPDNGSYRDFVALDRDAVAWNVVATPELSVKPERWCYPIAGCVPYRGFFNRERASEFAEELRRAGQDVRIAAVAGYSTLGWFRDPILSTQLKRNDLELAALIFHELAHQEVYIAGDAAFNESFATAVEKHGMKAWLKHQGSPEQFARWESGHRMQLDFVRLLRGYRDRLEALYVSTVPIDERRAGKRRLFAELRTSYGPWKKQWGDDARYDQWFAQELNNAHLAGVDLYYRHVAAFDALFVESRSDFAQFYSAVRNLSRMPQADREQQLAALATRTALIR